MAEETGVLETTATGAEQGTQGTEGAQNQQQGQQTEGQQTSLTGSEGGDNQQQQSQATVHIEYTDFTVPEGFEKPSEDFLSMAKEIGMSQENVQKVVDYYTGKMAPQIASNQQAALEAQNKEWMEQSTKALGQDGVEKSKLAYQQFATPELKEFLSNTGLGSHPAMVAMFKSIGEKMGESTLVNGNGSVAEPKRAADVLFGQVK